MSDEEKDWQIFNTKSISVYAKRWFPRSDWEDHLGPDENGVTTWHNEQSSPSTWGTIDGKKVFPGDWLVDSGERKEVITDQEFKFRYELRGGLRCPRCDAKAITRLGIEGKLEEIYCEADCGWFMMEQDGKGC